MDRRIGAEAVYRRKWWSRRSLGEVLLMEVVIHGRYMICLACGRTLGKRGEGHDFLRGFKRIGKKSLTKDR